MATAIAVRPPTTVDKLFTEIFPLIDGTEQQSAAFVKQLLSVSVSNLIYVRGIFPEDSFTEKDVHGIKLRMLKNDKDGPVKQITTWLNGCFDAVDKKYARMISFGIYSDPDNPNKLLEAYYFKFTYTEDGDVHFSGINHQSIPATVDSLKEHTFRILNTIVLLTHMMNPLPEEVYLTMKILYYDDITPEDYHPVGFGPADSTSDFAEECITLKIGDANCTHHSLRVRVKTASRLWANGHPPGNSVEVTDDSQNIGDKAVDDHGDDCSINSQELTNHDTAFDNSEENMQTSKMPQSELKMDIEQCAEGDIQCTCGANVEDGLLLCCEVCTTWQHGVCYGIDDENIAPENHTCYSCYVKNPSLDFKDNIMMGLSEAEVQHLCLWRRTLDAIKNMPHVHPAQISHQLGITQVVANQLMTKLKNKGIVSNARNATKPINQAILRKEMEMVWPLNNREVDDLVNKTEQLIVLKEKSAGAKSNDSINPKHANLLENQIQCACMNTNTHGLPMVQCTLCSLWQHAICCGIDKVANAGRHICMFCAKPGVHQCELSLEKMDKIEMKRVCCYRKALLMCTFTEMLKFSGFAKRMNVTDGYAKLLIQDLVANGILVKASKGQKYEVIIKKSQLALQKLYKEVEVRKQKYDINVAETKAHAVLNKLKLRKKTSPISAEENDQEAIEIEEVGTNDVRNTPAGRKRKRPLKVIRLTQIEEQEAELQIREHGTQDSDDFEPVRKKEKQSSTKDAVKAGKTNSRKKFQVSCEA